MNDETIKILNQLHREQISLGKACALLKVTSEEIDILFDDPNYFSIFTAEDEKEILKLEDENIKKIFGNEKKKTSDG